MEDRFDLSKAVATWRQFQARNHRFLDEDLDELEVHLRAHTAELLSHGWTEESAFREAVRALGDMEDAKTEYRKVYLSKLKRKHKLTNEFRWRGSMLKNYLKVVLRGLLKQPGYTLVNILGLSVGLGVCLVIFQYVQFEMSHDTFHSNHQNMYRVLIEESAGSQTDTHPYVDYAFGVQAKEEIPEVTQYVRKERFNRDVIVTNPINNNMFYEYVNDILFVDRAFFDTFDFPLQQGNRSTLFDDNYSIVITEAIARKYFGENNPLGETLEISGPPSPGSYTITGVLDELPLNSHLQFDMLIPVENYLEYGWGGAVKKQGGWDGFKVITYLTLEPSADVLLIEDKLDQLIAANTSRLGVERSKVILQPIADVYMNSGTLSDPGFMNVTGDIEKIRLFSVISFFILFMAWVNYVNLSTAQSMKRSREVGIRKAVGAEKKQLMSQFLLESILVNMLAAGLAIGIAALLLPVLNTVTGKELTLSVLRLPIFWSGFSLVVLLGSVLSGLYPAFVLSAFQPISVLKSKSMSKIGTMNLRRGLIVFQFLTALLLISGTYLIYKQTHFMKSQELSIDMEKILVVRGPQASVAGDTSYVRFSAFRNELLGHSSITEVAGSLFGPGQFWVMDYKKQGQMGEEAPYARTFYAGKGFSETYGLKFLAGSPFTDVMPDEEVAIINESALAVYGLGSPDEAIHTNLVRGKRTLKIVGVVEDFHWHSLHEGQMPYVVSLYENVAHPYISVRINSSNIVGTIAYIESAYRTAFPDDPFTKDFANVAFNRAYQADEQFGNLFFSFTALAIFIACIGLFTLVSYSTNARIKEIGIRKVLGASTQQLMVLLSREYLKPLSLAIALSVPVILFFGAVWLENYAYRINMSLDMLVVPALVLIVISIATVSYRTYSTVNMDPVKSLKGE